jgi:hypothetical protein
MRRVLCALFGVIVVGSVACSAQGESANVDDVPAETVDGLTTVATVRGVADASCSTSVVRGLSDQLVAEIACSKPGVLASVAKMPRLGQSAAVMPYLETDAAEALKRVVKKAGGISINSALRTVPQQWLLFRWGAKNRCSIHVVMPPGQSTHEPGLAVDVEDHERLRPVFESEGFEWWGADDPMHFTYHPSADDGGATGEALASDALAHADLAGEGVKAFQRLWNRNHPDDTIPESGVFDATTELKLAAAPAKGFTKGATCTPAFVIP